MTASCVEISSHVMNLPMRVLLLEVPMLLRGILEHAIQQEPDYELIVDGTTALPTGSEQPTPPDVVIVGLTAVEDMPLLSALFARWPGAHVLTIMQTDGEAAVYKLTSQRQILGDMSPLEILSRLRDSVRRKHELCEDVLTPATPQA
jgi:DNA-binding NarL/FixJ family response regulator